MLKIGSIRIGRRRRMHHLTALKMLSGLKSPKAGTVPTTMKLKRDCNCLPSQTQPLQKLRGAIGLIVSVKLTNDRVMRDRDVLVKLPKVACHS